MTAFRELGTGMLLIDGNPWRASPFRSPVFQKDFPSNNRQAKSLAVSAQPWYPPCEGLTPVSCSSKSHVIPSPVLLSPAISFTGGPGGGGGRAVPQLTGDFTPLDSGVFSPLSTPVSTVFHSISDEAAARRVYPIDMILSARQDASHTPHGILQWCAKQYLEIPSLKVPSHLAFSLNEACSSEDVLKNSLAANRKSSRARLTRQIHSKVMYILSRITPQKYNELLDELLQLPLRQSDDNELQEVVNVFFEKASDESEYSHLYAKLLEVLCTMQESEAALESELQKRLLCSRVREILLRSWEQRSMLRLLITEDDKVDRTTGEALNEEELQKKASRMKNKIVGNILFLAELILIRVVPEVAIHTVLHNIIGEYDPADPLKLDESTFEMFNKFLKRIGTRLYELDSSLCAHYYGVAKRIRQSHPRCRIQFMMDELEKMREEHQWPIADPVLPLKVKTLSSSVFGDSFVDGLSSSSASMNGGDRGSYRQYSDPSGMPLPHSHSNGRQPMRSPVLPLTSDSTGAGSPAAMALHRADQPQTPFNNLLLLHLVRNDELHMFSELSTVDKKRCMFDFLTFILTGSTPFIQNVPQLLAKLTPTYMKDITLGCIIISYVRDEIPRLKDTLPTILDRVYQLLTYFKVQAAISNFPHIANLFYMNYFNLILTRVAGMDYPLAHILRLGYPVYTSLMDMMQSSNDPVYILSAASLSTFRFLYAAMPKRTVGRCEASAEILQTLKSIPDIGPNNMELQLFDAITQQLPGWEDACVARVMENIARGSTAINAVVRNPTLTAIKVMNAVDVLLTCTAVSSSKGVRPLLFPIDAAVVLGKLMRMLNSGLYEGALLLELLNHCNQYPMKYNTSRAVPTLELFTQFVHVLGENGAFQNRKEALGLLQTLGSNEKTLFGVHQVALATKNGINLSQAVSVMSMSV